MCLKWPFKPILLRYIYIGRFHPFLHIVAPYTPNTNITLSEYNRSGMMPKWKRKGKREEEQEEKNEDSMNNKMVNLAYPLYLF